MAEPRVRRLLTLDEARAAFASSALLICDSALWDPFVLLGILYGQELHVELPPHIAGLARTHRENVLDVAYSGHDWILQDEVEGACSYAGCDLAELMEDLTEGSAHAS